MAHAKAVNRKKNNDDYEDSPHHDGTQPITGGDQGQGDDYENAPLPPPKKKKNKIKPPTSLNSSGVGMYVFFEKIYEVGLQTVYRTRAIITRSRLEAVLEYSEFSI